MKNIVRDNAALTLTELIIAMSLVGLVMLGTVSSDYAIHQQADKAHQGLSGAINAQSILTHIMTNAYLLTGSNVPGDGSGYWTSLNGRTFCLRRPQDPNTISSPLVWSCYTNPAGLPNSSPNFYYCTRSAAGNCASTDPDYTDFGPIEGVVPAVVRNSAVGTSQITFTATVSVLDSSYPNGIRSISGSVTPYNYTYTP